MQRLGFPPLDAAVYRYFLVSQPSSVVTIARSLSLGRSVLGTSGSIGQPPPAHGRPDDPTRPTAAGPDVFVLGTRAGRRTRPGASYSPR